MPNRKTQTSSALRHLLLGLRNNRKSSALQPNREPFGFQSNSHPVELTIDNGPYRKKISFEVIVKNFVLIERGVTGLPSGSLAFAVVVENTQSRKYQGTDTGVRSIQSVPKMSKILNWENTQ